ncbi:MAG: hypothetical protein TRG1_3568 [Flavobacteriaceae bacterium FS1-H7996/R]|nr:MAG: hypothetical protein TRG1_3568 [Flavobacteriaceae bacterium FS1-H7996/R]
MLGRTDHTNASYCTTFFYLSDNLIGNEYGTLTNLPSLIPGSNLGKLFIALITSFSKYPDSSLLFKNSILVILPVLCNSILTNMSIFLFCPLNLFILKFFEIVLEITLLKQFLCSSIEDVPLHFAKVGNLSFPKSFAGFILSIFPPAIESLELYLDELF